jgi:carboxymethylenebutenolidase
MSPRHETIRLEAEDGTQLSAYHVLPAERPRGGLVVLQEIFGVNAHIRRVADGFAEHGYEVLAPALFDRLEPGVELGYDADGMAKGRSFPQRLGWDGPLRDVAAAIAALRGAALRGAGRIGVVGYCWGGSLAYLAAARLSGLAAAVGYYGTAIAKNLDATPQVPTLLHFGATDASIPAADIEAIRARHPHVGTHVYAAGHGFNCDARAAYEPASAALALERTLAFFAQHLGHA